MEKTNTINAVDARVPADEKELNVIKKIIAAEIKRAVSETDPGKRAV